MRTKHRINAKTAGLSKHAAGEVPGTASAAYGDKATICTNTDCKLRKKAGGCFGFEGCPGFKAR